METNTSNKIPFLIKVSSLFVLLAIGYYKNQHAEIGGKMRFQKNQNPPENALTKSEDPPAEKDFTLVHVVYKK